jgi:hypothetical protein
MLTQQSDHSRIRCMIRYAFVLLLLLGIMVTIPSLTPVFATRTTEQKISRLQKRYTQQQAKLERKFERKKYRVMTRQVKRHYSAESYCRKNHLNDRQCIDAWISRNNLNMYGDSNERVYIGGTPLFNESTGRYINRYYYIRTQHPDAPWWKMQ